MRDVLARPFAFRAFNAAIGAGRARELFVSEHVRPHQGDRVLDIGCGIGEILPYLPAVDYVGFDENAAYIAAARARHPGVPFSCERVDTHVVTDEAFDIALASAVLHHLDDAGALQLLRLAHGSLRPGGRLVSIDGCYTAGQGRVVRWLLSRDRGRYVRSADEYVRLMRAVFSEVQTAVRHDLLRVPYTHFIADCTRV